MLARFVPPLFSCAVFGRIRQAVGGSFACKEKRLATAPSVVRSAPLCGRFLCPCAIQPAALLRASVRVVERVALYGVSPLFKNSSVRIKAALARSLLLPVWVLYGAGVSSAGAVALGGCSEFPADCIKASRRRCPALCAAAASWGAYRAETLPRIGAAPAIASSLEK